MRPLLLAGIIALGGILSVIWLYVAARVVTRGILRTIKERRGNRHG